MHIGSVLQSIKNFINNVNGKYKTVMITVSFLIALLILLLPFFRPADLPVFFLMLGRIHPLILHFPIVLILLVFCFELARRFNVMKQGKTIVTLLLVAAAVTTLISVIAGYLLFASGEYSGALMERHLWGGVITGASVFVATGCYFLLDRFPRLGTLYFISLFVSASSVGYTSHMGGSITHGQEYLTEYLPLIFKSDDHVPRSEEDMLVYDDMLAPIFEAKCLSCHNADRAKGGLLMTSFQELLKGGESGKTSITPMKPEESELYSRIILPEGHDDRMPPEGKSPMTEMEVSLLRHWIEKGAEPTLGVKTMRQDKDTAPVIDNLLAELVRYRRRQGLAAVKSKTIEEELLKVGERLGLSIRRDSTSEGNYFTLSMKFPPAPLTNNQFRELSPYFEVFSKASLVSSDIDDSGLYYVGQMKNLRALYLQKTRLDGSGIVHLKGLRNLELLNLSFTRVDDKAALDLLRIPNLKEVYLFRTNTSVPVIDALRKYRPGLTINREEGPYF